MQSGILLTSELFEKTMHSLKASKMSMPTRREWIKSYEMIPEKKYDIYFKHFNLDSWL